MMQNTSLALIKNTETQYTIKSQASPMIMLHYTKKRFWQHETMVSKTIFMFAKVFHAM